MVVPRLSTHVDHSVPRIAMHAVDEMLANPHQAFVQPTDKVTTHIMTREHAV